MGRAYLCLCTPVCIYTVHRVCTLLIYDFSYSPSLGSEIVGSGHMCVRKILALSQWQFETRNLLQRMGSVYLRHFDPEHQGKKIQKNSRTTTPRTKLPRFGAEIQQPGSPEVSNCSLRQKPPCPSPEKEQLHLSSLNLLAPISFFLPFGLSFDVWRELICFQCGLTRNAGCREVARQEKKEYRWWTKELASHGGGGVGGRQWFEDEELKTSRLSNNTWLPGF